MLQFGRRSAYIPVAIVAVFLASCGIAVEYRDEKLSPMRDVVLVNQLTLPGMEATDRLVFERHPLELSAVAAPGAAIDSQGLIGKNRKYGRMVSPRFQLGAGSAVRVGLHRDERTMSQAGFRAIEAGVSAIAQDGQVMSETPPDASAGAVPSDGDKASGAAFFLSDACSAMLALQSSEKADEVTEMMGRALVTEALGRAAVWLLSQRSALQRVDRHAPNRLLFDALAFQACGALIDNQMLKDAAQPFVAAALAQARSDGVFAEKGGSDTTYQAVSVRLALDLLLSGYSGGNEKELNLAWQRGAIWLGTRIMADGRIDSTGNTRTCSGGESFMGAEKRVWPPGVYGALIYAGELSENVMTIAAAQRLSKWAQANQRSDPCFAQA
jgi:hypothetical protein